MRRGKKSLGDFAENEEKRAVWSLILLKEAPNVDDVIELYELAYKFALKYTQKIADMWYKYLLTEEIEAAPCTLSAYVNALKDDEVNPFR